MKIANFVSLTLALAIFLIGCSEPEPQEMPKVAQNGTVTGTTGNHSPAAITAGVNVGGQRGVNDSPENYIEWPTHFSAEMVIRALESIVRGQKDWEIAALPSGGGMLFEYSGPEMHEYFGCITVSFEGDRKHCTIYASPLYPEVRKVLREVHAKLELKTPITFS